MLCDATCSAEPTTLLFEVEGRAACWFSNFHMWCCAVQVDKVAGLGMNADELARNPVLTEWCV